jgi:hypothetical protein
MLKLQKLDWIATYEPPPLIMLFPNLARRNTREIEEQLWDKRSVQNRFLTIKYHGIAYGVLHTSSTYCMVWRKRQMLILTKTWKWGDRLP